MQAFPTSQSERYPQIIEGGMELRDYFAAKVMQYWMSNPMSSMHIENMCKGAYQVAEAMIEARKKK